VAVTAVCACPIRSPKKFLGISAHCSINDSRWLLLSSM